MRLDVAASIPMNSYLEARSSAVSIRDDFVGTLCKVDVLLSPVSAGGPSMITAPDLEWLTWEDGSSFETW